MRLLLERIRPEKNYRIGYIRLIDEYVMVIASNVDGLTADDYYHISPDMYEAYEGSLARLDQIAEEHRRLDIQDPEFLFSSEVSKNDEKQNEIYLNCEECQRERVIFDFDWL